MNLTKLGTALAVVLALAAVMASSAFAAATTTDVRWFTGASPGTLLSGSESISASGETEFITAVGPTELRLKSTELECGNCRIENTGVAAVGSGNLTLKKVTVVKPSNCAVRNGVTEPIGTIETKHLFIYADYMEGTTSYVLFTPAAGTLFAEVEIIKGTGACAIQGKYTVTGNDFVKENNATGTFAVSQGLTSSGPINNAAGGNLEFGGVNASLNTTGTAIALSGTKKGTSFATK